MYTLYSIPLLRELIWLVFVIVVSFDLLPASSEVGIRLAWRVNIVHLRVASFSLSMHCKSRFIYSRDDLLQLSKTAGKIPRKTRRSLWYLGILRRPQSIHVSGLPIPVHISSRAKTFHPKSDSLAHANSSTSHRVLHRVKCIPNRRLQLKVGIPSLLLSNVCSISNKLDEAQVLISKLRPDIVLLVETWLNGEIPDQAVSIPQYNIFRCDRNTAGGGIMCYVSHAHSAQKLELISPSRLLACKTEMLCVFVKELDLLVLSIYHCVWNNVSVHEDALSVILEAIDKFLCSPDSTPSSKIILCGDFNDLHKYSTRISHLTNLKPFVHVPTRRGKPLDLIFSNYSTDVNATVLPPLGRSDHSVVFWRPSAAIHSASFVKKTFRKFSKANIALFREKAACTDWLSFVKSIKCLDSCASIFLSTLKCLFDYCFPSRTALIRQSDPVWMTPSLKFLMKSRDDAWYAGKWLKYKRLRSAVIESITYVKSSFLLKASSMGKAKDLWKHIKNFSRSSKTHVIPPSISSEDFGDYFASVFGSDTLPPLEDLSDLMCDLPHSPLKVSVQEVETLLNTVKRKSSGPDGLPSWVLKDLNFCIAPAVTHIFNRSFSEAHVPLCFKEALILPIPKVQKPSQCDDYRPISLLPLLSKALEKLVLRSWFVPFLKSVDPLQFAYLRRCGSGCVSALLLMHHNILKFLDKKSGCVRLLALDYSKAFDKLPHISIVRSCIDCNIPAQAVRWIFSYLQGRRQKVMIQGHHSSWHYVSSGVPQGSILGPILFCCVMSSLKPICSNSQMIKYADDVSILHFIREFSEDKLQDELDYVISWSAGVGLQLNFNKCSVVNFITSKSLQCAPITTSSGCQVRTCERAKVLGVTFSSNLRWNDHFDDVIRKASRRIFIIRNLKRSGCKQDILYRVYVAMIRSVLFYCYPCLCNAPLYLLRQVLNVEKRVFKIIFSDNVPINDCLFFAENTCKSLFTQIHDNPDHPLRILFDKREPSRTNRLLLCPPQTKTKRFSDSFIKFCKL